MKALPAGNLLTILAEIPDPRERHGRRHSLPDILATVVARSSVGHGARMGPPKSTTTAFCRSPMTPR